MHALSQYQDAKKRLAEARGVINLIGKVQSTTAQGVGTLHGVEVKATVHYQPTDGAKNYHESNALNAALGSIVRKHWDSLLSQALGILEQQVEDKRAAAAAEYKAEFEAA